MMKKMQKYLRISLIYKNQDIKMERDSYLIYTDKKGTNYWVVVIIADGKIVSINKVSAGSQSLQS